MGNSKKYTPREIGIEVLRTVKEEVLRCQEPKTFSPKEVVKEVANTLRQELTKFEQNSSTPNVEDNASEPITSPAKPTELNQKALEVPTGRDRSHVDAVEHHAFHAAARFHEGDDGIAENHLVLAKAHALVAGIDSKPFAEFAYEITECMDVSLSDVFGRRIVTHPLDKALPQKIKKMGGPPGIFKGSSEEVDIASGKGKDKKHVGPTPDDRKPKEIGDDHAQETKVKKDEMGPDKKIDPKPDKDKASDSKVRAKQAKDDYKMKYGKGEDEDKKKKKKKDDDKDEDEKKLEKDYVAPDIERQRSAKGYKKPKSLRVGKQEDKEIDLDGKGSGVTGAYINKK